MKNTLYILSLAIFISASSKAVYAQTIFIQTSPLSNALNGTHSKSPPAPGYVATINSGRKQSGINGDWLSWETLTHQKPTKSIYISENPNFFKIYGDLIMGISLGILTIGYSLMSGGETQKRVKLITLRWLDIVIYALVATIALRIGWQFDLQNISILQSIKTLYEKSYYLYCVAAIICVIAIYSATYNMKIWHPKHKLINTLYHPNILFSVAIAAWLLAALSELALRDTFAILALALLSAAWPNLLTQKRLAIPSQNNNDTDDILTWLTTRDPKKLPGLYFKNETITSTIAHNFISG